MQNLISFFPPNLMMKYNPDSLIKQKYGMQKKSSFKFQMQHIDEYGSARISLSVLVLLQAVFTANTPICGHIFIQFIIRPSALPLSLSFLPLRLVCL